MGFHYLGIHGDWRKVCLGYIEFSIPNNIEELKSNCEVIAKNWELIYYESLGDVFTPQKYKGFHSILKHPNFSDGEKLDFLLDDEWIKPYLY